MTTTNPTVSAEGIQVKYKQLLSQLDTELSKYKYCNEIERRTGVPKSYFALGAGGLVTLMIFFNLAGQLLSSAISWVYPAYASFKAIETPAHDDDRQWLTYWTVLGFVQIVEYFSDILLFWFPFYYLFKTIFVLWLAMPQTRGAVMIYGRFLRPFLLKAQNDVDKSTKEVRDKVKEFASEVSSSAKTE